MNEYIYVIVRNDLSNSQKLVQACHAVAEMSKQYSLNETVQFMVALAVDNEQELLQLENDLENNLDFETYNNKIKFASFREADLGNSLTAIATVPIRGDVRLFFKDFKLLQ